jgi:hypothetical protein
MSEHQVRESLIPTAYASKDTWLAFFWLICDAGAKQRKLPWTDYRSLEFKVPPNFGVGALAALAAMKSLGFKPHSRAVKGTTYGSFVWREDE